MSNKHTIVKKTNPQRLQYYNRVEQIMQLRLQGMTFNEIAEEMPNDYTGGPSVRNALVNFLEQRLSEETTLVRGELNARYEALIRAWWPAAIGIDHDGNLLLNKEGEPVGPLKQAAEIVMKAMRDMARLNGLYQAQIQTGDTNTQNVLIFLPSKADDNEVNRQAQLLEQEFGR